MTKNEIMELTRLCTEQPYFECEIGFFAQSKGTHMGGTLSKLLADLIIENKIEKKIAPATSETEEMLGLGQVDR